MEEKDLYQKKLESKLKEIKARMEMLEAKAVQAKAEFKPEYQKHLYELRQKREALRSKLDEIKKSSGEAWKDLKSGMEKAADDLKQAIDKAIDKLH